MNRKKKLLIVSTTGGTLIFYQNLMPELKQEFEVVVCSRNDVHSDRFSKEYCVNLKHVDFSRNFELKSDLRAFWQMREVISLTKPDIILFNTPKASTIGLLVSRSLGVFNRIYVIHGLRYQGFSGTKRLFYSWIERLNFLNSTNLVSVSEGIRSTLTEERMTKKNLELFHFGSLSGVDVKKFTLSRKQKIGSKQKLRLENSSGVFGFVGRLTEDKGIFELLNAFIFLSKKHTNIHLLLVGPMDSKNAKIEKMIDSCASILWIGEVSNVQDYLAAMDVFVFPTYREGLGMSLIEAQIAGVPVIASDVTGCNEIVKHESTGILIPVKNSNRLALEMETLLLSSKMRSELARNAQVTAVKRYNSKSVTYEVMRFLRSM